MVATDNKKMSAKKFRALADDSITPKADMTSAIIRIVPMMAKATVAIG
jgi:hypothetical protein